MNKPKWSEEKHAWADGKAIEQRYASPEQNIYQDWHAFDRQWDKQLGWEYRIKPIPKPDVIVHKLMNFLDPCSEAVFTTSDVIFMFNGETSQLKSVRMIGKPDPEKMRLMLEILEKDMRLKNDVPWQTKIEDALRTD